jgi:hypothetical protein
MRESGLTANREIQQKPGTDLLLTKSLKDIWAQERREGDPKIKFHFAFASHVTPGDVSPIKKEFTDTDILFSEGMGGTELDDKLDQALASGRITPQEIEENALKRNPQLKKTRTFPYTAELRRLIYNSGKVVGNVDLPEGHRLIEGYKLTFHLSMKFHEAKTLEEKMDLVKRYIIFLADLNVERERYILEQIPRKLRKILDSRPELKKRSEVKVLVSMGAVHTPMYIEFKNLEKMEAARSFSDSTFLYFLGDQAMRMRQFGQDVNSMPKEFFARMAIETDILTQLEKSIERITTDFGVQGLVKRLKPMLESLSYIDIENIYKKVSKGEKFRNALLEVCKVRGIKTTGF